MSLPSYLPPPRLCHLVKWPAYNGYGFNLHAEKGKSGQYIGKVDPDSPAELGGLKTKDYLIEVNGTNVEDLTHQKVVERVKEMPEMVRMLVAESETYKYCKEMGIVISPDMPEVVVHYTPDTQPTKQGGNSHHEIRSEASQHQQQQLETRHHDLRHDETDSVTRAAAIKEIEEEKAIDSEPEVMMKHAPQQQQQQQHQQPHSAAAIAPSSQSQSGGSGGSNGSAAAVKDPVANISLEEMRAKIGSNRRNQAKMNPSSFSEKYSMFQAL